MKLLRLPGKSKTGSRFETLQGSALDTLHLQQSSTVGRRQFFIENVRRFTGRHKQVTIQPLEIAFNFFLRYDGFNAIDCRGVTLGGKPGAFFAVEMFEFKVAIVE